MNRPTESSPTSRPFSLPSGRSLRILYIDQPNALRDVARLSLRRLGHTMECVGDGIMALGKVPASPPFDLVIAEHGLPSLGGCKLVGRLRAKGYEGKIIIICTELGAADEAEYSRLGVDRLLFKPVLPSSLRTCISELFPGAGRVG
jgi:CheY-like chemotaxis protein